MSNHCIWLDHGVLVGSGQPDEVIDEYLDAQKIKKPKGSATGEDI